MDRIGDEGKGKKTALEMARGKVKFEAFGEEMLEKKSASAETAEEFICRRTGSAIRSKLSGSTDS